MKLDDMTILKKYVLFEIPNQRDEKYFFTLVLSYMCVKLDLLLKYQVMAHSSILHWIRDVDSESRTLHSVLMEHQLFQ